MHLSVRPKDKDEAARWIRQGIELVVIDSDTNYPIRRQNGRFDIDERGWTAIVTLKNGLVTKIE